MPSRKHERRVHELETVATLAGFTSDVAIAPALKPDVFRADFAGRRFFLGDAKVTERPSTPATRARLARYARASRAWAHAARGAVLAIAMPHPADAREWVDVLVDVARDAGLVPFAASAASLGESTVVVAVEAVAAGTDAVVTPGYRLAPWPDLPTSVDPCVQSTFSAAREV